MLWLLAAVSVHGTDGKDETKDTIEKEVPQVHLKDRQYVEWTFKNFADILQHPMDLPKQRKSTTLFELPLGMIMMPFLLLEDIRAIPRAEDYPYLHSAIYTPTIKEQSQSTHQYILLRTALYGLITLTTLVLLILGNPLLISMAILGLGSWLCASITATFFGSTIVNVFAAMIPLMVGSRFILTLQYTEKGKEKWQKLIAPLKTYKKSILLNGAFIMVSLYLLVSAVRLQLRVEANKKRIIDYQNNPPEDWDKQDEEEAKKEIEEEIQTKRQELAELNQKIIATQQSYNQVSDDLRKTKEELAQQKNKFNKHNQGKTPQLAKYNTSQSNGINEGNSTELRPKKRIINNIIDENKRSLGTLHENEDSDNNLRYPDLHKNQVSGDLVTSNVYFQ